MSKKVVIDRAYWGRGRFLKGLQSYLRNPSTNQMCCLGFVCNQAYDIDIESMNRKFYPMDIASDLMFPVLGHYHDYNQNLHSAPVLIAMINDDIGIKDESKREMMIADMLLYFYDIEVEYIN